MKTFRRLTRYLSRYWPLQAATLLVAGGATALNLVIPLFAMLLIDRVIGEREVALLAPLMMGFLGVLVGQGLLTVLRDYLFARVAQLVLRDLRLDLCRRILRWPYASFHREPVGQIMARVQSDTWNIHDLLSSVFVTTFADIITLIAALSIVFFMDWRLSLLAVGCLPLFVWAFAFFRRRTGSAAMATQVATGKVSEELQGIFSSIKEIKAQWAYRPYERRLGQRLGDFLRAFLRQQLLQSFARTVVAFLAALAPMAVFWYGALEVLRGFLTVGQLVAFNTLLGYLFGPTQRLAQLNISLQIALAAATRVFEFMDRPSESREGRRPHRIRRGLVSLEDVHFSYVPGQVVLAGVNMTLPPGSRAALVGASGSGKSTIADLLLGLYSPTAGRVLLDGRDAQTVNLASLRLQMACVPQDPVLFAGTVAENISFARPSARPDEILAVSKLLGVDQFTKLSDVIGERGVTLSLGQRQRIGIARSILKRPAVLVLDEASSGLDPETEKQVWLSLSEWLESTTILLITHRLLSVSDMDQIHFIADGRIVEQGRHEDLMASTGAYYHLFQEQFRQRQPGGPPARG
jgi:ABC-type bacteriocin/lantibiotic exporter with double-glycine peptidase domain